VLIFLSAAHSTIGARKMSKQILQINSYNYIYNYNLIVKGFGFESHSVNQYICTLVSGIGDCKSYCDLSPNSRLG
jgi:hypothetical protein